MAYSNKVLDHYENPRNVGSLPKDDANVGTGLVGAPECGDVMKLQVKINPDTGKPYTHAEASFAARDLLDFSGSGAWPAIKTRASGCHCSTGRGPRGRWGAHRVQARTCASSTKT